MYVVFLPHEGAVLQFTFLWEPRSAELGLGAPREKELAVCVLGSPGFLEWVGQVRMSRAGLLPQGCWLEPP